MDLKSKIESLLFITGEPVSVKRLAKFLNSPEKEIESVLDELRKDYEKRGVVIMKKEDEYQFGTHPQNAKLVEELVKSELSEELTKASLETLTIIAYKGPMTRAEVEFLRGVNSSFIMRNLLLRGLVERIENPKDARSYLYKVSFDFLKYLGLTSVEELLGYKELRQKSEEVAKIQEEMVSGNDK